MENNTNEANEVIDDCLAMFDSAALLEGVDVQRLAAAHGLRGIKLIADMPDQTLAKALAVILARQFLDLAKVLNGEQVDVLG